MQSLSATVHASIVREVFSCSMHKNPENTSAKIRLLYILQQPRLGSGILVLFAKVLSDIRSCPAQSGSKYRLRNPQLLRCLCMCQTINAVKHEHFIPALIHLPYLSQNFACQFSVYYPVFTGRNTFLRQNIAAFSNLSERRI